MGPPHLQSRLSALASLSPESSHPGYLHAGTDPGAVTEAYTRVDGEEWGLFKEKNTKLPIEIGTKVDFYLE